MKNKDYLNLINSDNGFLIINNFCTLHRWTNSFGEKVDKLTIIISINNHAEYTSEILTRDVKSIKEEVKQHLKIAFEKALEKLCNNIDNNYN